MTLPTYSITFACYNAVDYTRKCVDSMLRHGTPLDRLVVVDNGSTDATRDYLETLPLGGRIYNRTNLGCGVAWNQGALVQQAEWSIIMNNDVLVSPGWIESLISAAQRHDLRIVSPALIEGPNDYDFDAFATDVSARMANVLRLGNPHAVCLAVHESVWMDIGYFRSMPKLWGYEDTIFFHDARQASIPMATTGASWLHHFGSITQSEMKRERGLSQKEGLSGRRNYRYLNQSWLARKLHKRQKVANLRAWRADEVARYGATLHGVRESGEFRWY
jgi:N-acetylglucosaminyl-diphospho-decaprenol L-rhamnosyltransferase